MAIKNTGGPAFPCDNIVERDVSGGLRGYEISSPGMTLRDRFAIEAMPWAMENSSDNPSQGITWKQAAAEICWEMADAMLEARGK